MKKVCTKCDELKEESNFHRNSRNKDGRVSECKSCVKIRSRIHNKKNHIRKKNYIRRTKEAPCTDCGIRYPYYAMDLDHIKDKKFNVNEYSGRTVKAVVEEVQKCEPVCPICHRRRTIHRMDPELWAIGIARSMAWDWGIDPDNQK